MQTTQTCKAPVGISIHTEDHLLIHLCLLGNLGLESSTVRAPE